VYPPNEAATSLPGARPVRPRRGAQTWPLNNPSDKQGIGGERSVRSGNAQPVAENVITVPQFDPGLRLMTMTRDGPVSRMKRVAELVDQPRPVCGLSNG